MSNGSDTVIVINMGGLRNIIGMYVMDSNITSSDMQIHTVHQCNKPRD